MYSFNSFLNFSCHYTAYGDINYKTRNSEYDKSPFPFRISASACFHYIFEQCDKIEAPFKCRYYIRCLKYNKDRTDAVNSNVLVNKEDMIKHISYAQDIFDFKFYIKEFTHYYGITLYITKPYAPVYHKFILSWVRYLYEFPMCLIPFIQKKVEKDFPELSPIILFLYIVSNISDYNNHHKICSSYRFPIIANTEELKERFERYVAVGNTRLNPLFDGNPTSCAVTKVSRDVIKNEEDFPKFEKELIKCVYKNYSIFNFNFKNEEK